MTNPVSPPLPTPLTEPPKLPEPTWYGCIHEESCSYFVEHITDPYQDSATLYLDYMGPYYTEIEAKQAVDEVLKTHTNLKYSWVGLEVVFLVDARPRPFRPR
jgi:hypothetical protein